MQKILTLDWSLSGVRGWVDLRIDFEDDEPVGEFLARLVHKIAPLHGLTGSSFVPWEGCGGSSLASLKWGDRISIFADGGRGVVTYLLASERRDQPAAEIRVLNGPDIGTCIPVPEGEFLIGRGAQAAVRLSDPAVSNAHLQLKVTSAGTFLRPLESKGVSAAVWVDGQQASENVAIFNGQRIDIGNTTFTLANVCERMDEHLTLLRAPQPVVQTVDEPINAPREPAKPDRKRLPVASIVLPAVIGLALALLVHPRMAIFALMSPVLMLVTFWEERRSARDLGVRQKQELECLEIKFAEELRLARGRYLELCEHRTPALGHWINQVREGGPLVWATRRDDANAFSFVVGKGTVEWPFAIRGQTEASARAKLLIDQSRTIEGAPITLTIGSGSSIGFVGSSGRDAVRAQLAQLISRNGPADLKIVVFTTPERMSGWAPLRLTAHGLSGANGGGNCVVTDIEELRVAWGPTAIGPQLVVLAIDRPGSECQDDPSLQQFLAEYRMRTALFVIAESDRGMARGCEGIFTLNAEHAGTISAVFRRTASSHDDLLPKDGQVIQSVLTMTPAGFRAHCWAVARFVDPFETEQAGSLGRVVTFEDLHTSTDATTAALDRWSTTTIRSLRVPVGMTSTGPLVIDLVADGPHALIAGTTGSGKSELLRALVLGLAAEYSPENVTFLLVDFKGGSAFGELCELPHVVGLVTDLDGRLAERTLVSLEAELRRRERILRSAGVSDLCDFVPSDATNPLPRLVVVIDEFATLAKELPSFIGALIGVAQRGRSLGIHLVLATQRPGGVVNDNIRANTNIRMCLRVQSPADSSDVLGVTAAATIDPSLPGRAFVRIGSGSAIEFQTALVGSTRADESTKVVLIGGAPAASQQAAFTLDRCDTRVLGASNGATSSKSKSKPKRSSNRIGQIATAFGATGRTLPRRPLQEPLRGFIDYRPMSQENGVGTIDDPEQQMLRPLDVHVEEENVALIGSAKSGKTTAIRSILLNAFDRGGQDSPQIYVVTFQPGQLNLFLDCVNVGAIIDGDDRERQARLWSMLTKEVSKRRADRFNKAQPIVLLIDGYSSLKARCEDALGMQLLEQLHRVIVEGPSVGITCLLSTDRWASVPGQVASGFNRRLVLRLNDTTDWMTLGFRPTEIPEPIPGRLMDTTSRLCAQVALATDETVSSVIAATNEVLLRTSGAGAPSIDRLPSLVRTTELGGIGSLIEGVLTIPIGLSGLDLVPEFAALHGGESFLITGPARSGKSSLMASMVAAFREATSDDQVGGRVFGVSPKRPSRSIDNDVIWFESVADLVAAINSDATEDNFSTADSSSADVPTLVVVDDAEFVEDPTGMLQRLVAERRSNVWIVASGRADVLRSAYSHWTVAVRKSRKGFAFRPNVDSDGDLWLTTLPRRSVVEMVVGRGYLVADGEAVLVQASLSQSVADAAVADAAVTAAVVGAETDTFPGTITSTSPSTRSAAA